MSDPYNGWARDTVIMLPEFESLFPGFNAVDDGVVSTYIDLAKLIFSACERATLYLAAHLLSQGLANDDSTSIDKTGGATLSDATIGELKAGYNKNVDNPTDVDFSTTFYGRTFIKLRNVCPRYRFALGVSS